MKSTSDKPSSMNQVDAKEFVAFFDDYGPESASKAVFELGDEVNLIPRILLFLISWQRNLLHKCFDITCKNELCSNVRGHKMKENRFLRINSLFPVP
jgi:hypothetical protein